jgi:hypothetical protein
MTIRFDELKVLPGESLTIQHIVLVIDARVKRREKRRCQLGYKDQMVTFKG